MEGVGGRVVVILLVLVSLVMVQAYVGPNNRRYPDYIVNPRYNCQEVGYFAHPKNCSWFVRCSDPYEIGVFWADYFECAPGTVFAQKIDQCIPGLYVNQGCVFAGNPGGTSGPVVIVTPTPTPEPVSFTVVCSYENERRLEEWMKSRYCETDACHNGIGNNYLCGYYAECKIVNGEYKPEFISCSVGMKYSFKYNKCTVKAEGVCPNTRRFIPNTIFVSGK